MMTKRRLITAVFCTLALLTNGAGALLQAQTQQRVRQGAPPPPPPPEHDITFERVPGPPPGHGEFFEMQIAPGAPGDSFNFTFMSSEMHFDSKIVRGAPYSAEAISESVQMLADGNRITRTSKASLYRDSEGRTRRDQALNHIGPWATADEPSQTVFINDPVAGAHYVLNPRTRTAQKMSNVFHFKRMSPDGENAPEGDAPRTQVFMRSEGGSSGSAVVVTSNSAKPINAGGANLSGKAIKKVQPKYPPIAKAAGAQGPVSVQIVINEAGDVESAKAVAGHPLLQQAAVDAAREWRFSPTKLSGNPVKVAGTISFVFALPKEDEPPAGTMMMRTPAPGDIIPEGEHRPKPVTESLGKQMIEGVEAEGTRTTVTFAAGAIGNERPINIVSERWYSPELQTVVMTKHSDPRFGETTYRLTNINRSEPSRTLFEVPSDYTLKEGPQSLPRKMRINEMKPRVEQQQ
ncbi:MAG TPA: energy transducer TonB [Pyrinomonadaceae bacterium]|nr:energy transducer TonB [Pyrinomonadaceae bacterium]